MDLHSYGAFNLLWAGTMPEAEQAAGAVSARLNVSISSISKYIIPWARIGKADPRSDNEGISRTAD